MKFFVWLSTSFGSYFPYCVIIKHATDVFLFLWYSMSFCYFSVISDAYLWHSKFEFKWIKQFSKLYKPVFIFMGHKAVLLLRCDGDFCVINSTPICIYSFFIRNFEYKFELNKDDEINIVWFYLKTQGFLRIFFFLEFVKQLWNKRLKTNLN